MFIQQRHAFATAEKAYAIKAASMELDWSNASIPLSHLLKDNVSSPGTFLLKIIQRRPKPQENSLATD